MKGGKGGTGRKRPTPARPDRLERLREQQRAGPSRGERKRDYGAIERDVPVQPRTDRKR
jgi:hypothetical protein